MLLAVAALFTAGIAWLARMARVAEPIRFLALASESSGARDAGGAS
jgi:hypothetical protein